MHNICVLLQRYCTRTCYLAGNDIFQNFTEDGSHFSFSLSLPNDSFDRREVFNQKCMRLKTMFLMNSFLTSSTFAECPKCFRIISFISLNVCSLTNYFITFNELHLELK